MLNEAQFEALTVELHKAIEEAAVEAVTALGPDGRPDLFYPPNAGLTAEEQDAIAALAPDPALVGALRKVVADAAAKPLFALFVMLDGVADPEGIDDFWPPWELVPSDDGQGFHDGWLDNYWQWRRRRPDAGWRLDTYSGD